jgi:uncharacterized protein (DUF433 family)
MAEPTAADPWTATLAWTPDQNGGAVSVMPSRVMLTAVWGALDAGEYPDIVANEYGLDHHTVHVLNILRRDLRGAP